MPNLIYSHKEKVMAAIDRLRRAITTTAATEEEREGEAEEKGSIAPVTPVTPVTPLTNDMKRMVRWEFDRIPLSYIVLRNSYATNDIRYDVLVAMVDQLGCSLHEASLQSSSIWHWIVLRPSSNASFFPQVAVTPPPPSPSPSPLLVPPPPDNNSDGADESNTAITNRTSHHDGDDDNDELVFDDDSALVPSTETKRDSDTAADAVQYRVVVTPLVAYLLSHAIPFDIGRYVTTPPMCMNVLDSIIITKELSTIHKAPLLEFFTELGAQLPQPALPWTGDDDRSDEEKLWRAQLTQGSKVHVCDTSTMSHGIGALSA